MNGWRLKVLVFGILLLLGMVLSLMVGIERVQEAILSVLDWVDQLGVFGGIVYFLIYVLVVVLLLPGIVFTVGAGFLFGFWAGGLIVVGALAVGSGIAFLVARYLFGERLSRRLRNHPRAQLLDKGLEKEGWKIVLLSRFLPVFPFKLSNYFFGLTRIPFRHFFFANLAGVMPLSLVNVYFGSLTAELTELLEREAAPWEWVVYGAAFVAAIGLIFLIIRIVRRSISEVMEEEETR